MKNIILSMLLCFVCLMSPLQATTLSQTEPTLKLNQLAYVPLHTPFMVSDMLYVSAEDLVAMTYGTYTQDADRTSLLIQNNKLVVTPNSRYIQINGVSKLMTHPSVLHQEAIYLPISCLEMIQYPYSFSTSARSLSIEPLMPYSLATDSYTSHHTLSTDYKTLEEALPTLNETLNKADLIKQALTNNQYLSFASTAYKQVALAKMKNIDLSSYQIKVHFRNLNCTGALPRLANFSVMPLSYSVNTDGLSLSFGDIKKSYNCFWATYNPSTHQTDIDLNKSLDVMVMRSLYESYRDLYDLKDDLEINPILTVQMGRSDAISYQAYLDSAQTKEHYEIIIYKKCTGSTIDYYVDFRLIS